MLEPETFVPRVVSWVPPRNVGIPNPIPALVRVAVERLLSGSAQSNTPGSIWRTPFLVSASTPYERPEMPANQAANEAATAQRRSRNSQTACLERLINMCRDKGWETQMAPGMARWKIVLAQAPNEQRLHVFAQPPLAVKEVIDTLWEAGLRIDGFSWSSTLSTVLESPEQMMQVRAMIAWLNNYCAFAPTVGLPPAPWRLTAARSLVERITSYDTFPLASN